MLEAGEDFVAEKLMELPEDMVTLALQRHILVINIDELQVQMEDRDDDVELVDKALESCLYQEFGEYQVISRRHDGWDSIVAILAALDKNDHELLERILERCCYMSSEYIAENGGLYDVLTSEEMLESDLAADREDRRAGEGFIAPTQAASFLALSRATVLDDVLAHPRDPVTRAYFRELAPATKSNGEEAANALPPAGGLVDRTADLEQMLGALDADEVPRDARPVFLLEGKSGTAPAGSVVFKGALAALHESDPKLHAARMEEIAYLCNVLGAGCEVDRRSFRPFEAVVAVAATCNLGLEVLTEPARGKGEIARRALSVLTRDGADKIFRVGWRTLHREVALATCDAVARAFASRARKATDPDLRRTFERGEKFVLEKRAQEKPALARNRLVDLLVDEETRAVLEGLLGECPVLVGPLTKEKANRYPLDRERQFVADKSDLGRVRAFLEGL